MDLPRSGSEGRAFSPAGLVFVLSFLALLAGGKAALSLVRLVGQTKAAWVKLEPERVGQARLSWAGRLKKAGRRLGLGWPCQAFPFS